jgi:hypothetical protein
MFHKTCCDAILQILFKFSLIMNLLYILIFNKMPVVLNIIVIWFSKTTNVMKFWLNSFYKIVLIIIIRNSIDI